jgi:hypothetical protein
LGRLGHAEDWISDTRRRLALHRTEKPATKAGQIRALWPEIQAALDNGQSLKSIRQWLEEEAGIVVSVSSFTSYISRIRRRETERPRGQETIEPRAELVSASSSTRTWIPNPLPLPNDPLAQAMQALSKAKLDIREIHGDGDPRGKNLI